MTERLEVRPVLSYPEPDYPGVPAPPDFAARRYARSILDEIRRGLARPVVALGLFAWSALPAFGQSQGEGKPFVAGDPDPGPSPREPGTPGGHPEIRMLTRDEISNLVSDIDWVTEESARSSSPFGTGRVYQSGYLSEEEGRALLKAFFAKNGFAIKEAYPLRERKIQFEVDGYDEERRVGYEYLAAGAQAAPVQPDRTESDLDPREVDEIDLAAARGGPAILVLEPRRYRYEHSPRLNRGRVVDELLEDVRRFFLWLAEEGRLVRMPRENGR